MSQLIAILDFGSQYTQILARRVREAQVYCEILPYNTPAETIKERAPSGIILSGGPASVLSENAPQPDTKIFDLGTPILGVCYGLQLFGHLFGGSVSKAQKREYGRSELHFEPSSPLFQNLTSPLSVWNSHGDHLDSLPQDFHPIAHTTNAPYAAIENSHRNFYALQFHPEVAHSQGGTQILHNFLFNICNCSADWQMDNIIDATVESIQNKVGSDHVILGLSGGVDSSVAAALIHKAIGDQLTCVFVDNGLLRKNERQEVEALFGSHFHMDLRVIDASQTFVTNLKGITDPEAKRKIIGATFIDAFNDAIKSIGDVQFLAQGTLYSDVIESASSDGNPAATIKSHHNVGGLPDDLKLQLLEPLRELFKDEVRTLGKELGLPDSLLLRHPFPGPGLGVRIIGEVTQPRLDILKEADAILLKEIQSAGFYQKLWQAFCVFLPVRSVGVMGDERTYEETIALRIVESEDAMTADWANLPHELLQKISNRIINEVQGINRVVLDISSKPPSTIEWE